MLAVRSLVFVVVFGLACPLLAETWPGWRGAAGSGVSTETDLPVRWSADDGLAWNIELPGRGNSSPAVTSDRVYVTTHMPDGGQHVIAVDRSDGTILWNVGVGKGSLQTFGSEELYAHRHNAATPSPVADEQHVWAFFGSGLLVCLDRTGKEVWRKDMVETYGAYNVRFGMGSSPRLWGDYLYLMCLHKGPSYIVALDKATGDEKWKTGRQLAAKDDGPDAYSSPVVLDGKERTELIVAGSDHVNSYNPATGEQFWISSGLAIDSQYGRIIASPAVSGRVVVACSANPLGGGFGRAVALRTDGEGDVTRSHQLWQYEPFTPDSPTPVCYDGRVYMVRDDGVGSCLDLRIGTVLWRKRLGPAPWRASLVAGDGKIYCLNRDGLCLVLQSGDEGTVLAENQLPGTFFATPAISDGRIYLRGHYRLYAIEGPGPSEG